MSNLNPQQFTDEYTTVPDYGAMEIHKYQHPDPWLAGFLKPPVPDDAD